MNRPTILTPEFVEYIPGQLENGKLYVSMAFATVAHKCCCGCGAEVNTPLSPTDWKLTFDGESVTLHPSIGNWNFACQSHYWIKRNRIEWAPRWSRDEIAAGRAYDQRAKEGQFAGTPTSTPPVRKPEAGFWSTLKKWWSP